MNNVALEVKDVIKSFSVDNGTINAVDKVSFSVKHFSHFAYGLI